MNSEIKVSLPPSPIRVTNSIYNFFSPNTAKMWNFISTQIQLKPIHEFKINIKKEIKQQNIKTFQEAQK